MSRERGPNRLLYAAWKSMRNRCNNPTNKDYDHYGGRGIRVCKEWDDYDRFVEDMGPKPEGLTLDRIDVNGPYSIDNCRWISRAEQTRNQTRNHRITANGTTLLISEWATKLGIHQSTICHRIRRGWTPFEAVTTGATK